MTPLGVGVYAWRTRPHWREIAVVAVAGTFVAVGAVAFSALAWWGSHNCMT